MRNEPPNSDAQTIWQDQNIEEMKMSLQQFKQKAEQLRVKSRWGAIAAFVVYGAVLIFLTFLYTRDPNPVSRGGLVLLAAGSLYVVWRTHKHLWAPPAPAAPAVNGLEAYKRELERSRDYSMNVLRMVAPLIPGAIVVALPAIDPLWRGALDNPKVELTNALPFCAVLAVLLVFLIPVRRRRLRKIQGEIDTLDKLGHPGLHSPGQPGTL